MSALRRHNQVYLLVKHRSSVELLRQDLQTRGFAAISFSDIPVALDAMSSRAPDLVMLDRSLPVALLRALQQGKQLHGFALIFIMHDPDQGPEPGSDFGADDCISSTLSVREAGARVEAVLQRREQAAGPTLVCDDLMIHVAERRVTIGGRRVAMSLTQLRLLQFFVQNQGLICPRELLLMQVWKAGRRPAARTVDVTVQRLRQLLRAGDCDHYIQTVRGGGYRFAPLGGGYPLPRRNDRRMV